MSHCQFSATFATIWYAHLVSDWDDNSLYNPQCCIQCITIFPRLFLLLMYTHDTNAPQCRFINCKTPYPISKHQPFLQIRFNFIAVEICVLVLCPLTGKPIACLLPLYVPISLNRVIFCTNSLRKSFSIFIFDSSALISSTFLLEREPRRAVGWMYMRASRCAHIWGPMP